MYVYSIWLVDPLSVKPSELEVMFPIWTLKDGKGVDCWDSFEGAREHLKVRETYNDWYYANRWVPELAEAGCPFHSMEEAESQSQYGDPEPPKPEGWDSEESPNYYALLMHSSEEFQRVLSEYENLNPIAHTVSIDDIFNQEDFM